MKSILFILIMTFLSVSINAEKAIESFVTGESSGLGYYQTIINNQYGIGLSGSFYSIDSSSDSNVTNLGLGLEARKPIQEDLLFNYGFTLGTSLGTTSGSKISDAFSIGSFFGFEKRIGSFSVESFTSILEYSTLALDGDTDTVFSVFSSGLGIKYYFR